MTSPSRRLAVVTAAVVLAGTPRIAESHRVDTPSAPTCFAIVLPSVQGVEGSASDVAAAVRELFIGFLTGPSIQTLSLDARLASQAVIEAQQKNCGQVLIASVVRKPSGGGRTGGILGQAIGAAAWRVPYGTGVGAAVASGAAIGGAHALSVLATETRRKDEIQLGYRVGTPGSVVDAKPVRIKAKARSDGEDLLTPLVERAAEDIASRAAAR